MKDRLRKTESDFNTLQQKFQKVMDFIKSLGLAEKLQEFLKARSAKHNSKGAVKKQKKRLHPEKERMQPFCGIM